MKLKCETNISKNCLETFSFLIRHVFYTDIVVVDISMLYNRPTVRKHVIHVAVAVPRKTGPCKNPEDGEKRRMTRKTPKDGERRNSY